MVYGGVAGLNSNNTVFSPDLRDPYNSISFSKARPSMNNNNGNSQYYYEHLLSVSYVPGHETSWNMCHILSFMCHLFKFLQQLCEVGTMLFLFR